MDGDRDRPSVLDVSGRVIVKRNIIQRNNTSGVNGIRIAWRRSEDPDGAPSLQVQASWRDKRTGKPRSTCYSVEKHGRLGATALAIAARAKGTGKPAEGSARQVWARIRKTV